MATVYLARDLKHHRLVAIKVLRPELADLLGRERFLREIDIAAGLQHNNILPLHDSGTAAGFFYYVMPYVEGESLRDRLDREKQLPLDAALHIAREVAEALHYAHSHEIIHRDIKPANIMLSGGHALVTDFGIARAVTVAGTQLTERGTAIGTPAYMSPEQATGQDAVDARSDQYSLACVLYEMLAGEPPFTGRTAQVILARHLQERPPSLAVVRSTVPPAIQDAIETALAKVPADRFQTVAAFADALMTTRERRVREQPLRRWLLPVGITVVLGVGLAVLWWWIGPSARSPGRAAARDPTHIAVLYFEDLSPGQTLRYVANGLTQDLIEKLGDVSALHVISPDGVRPYRSGTVALDSIANALEVGTVVAGSVAESNNRLRVSVRMIDPATGEQLLSQTLERAMGDIFALQDEITQDVSQALRKRLGQELELRQKRATTKNLAAWDLVQRAGEMEEDGSRLESEHEAGAAGERLWSADSLLQIAESLDRAWIAPILDRAEMAYHQWRLTGMRQPSPSAGAGVVDPQRQRVSETDWLRLAASHAERAFKLDPDDARVLELRGFLHYQLWVRSPDQGGVDQAERDLQAAVNRDAGRARAWFALSEIQRYSGRFAEANQSARRALEADAYLSEASQIVGELFFNALNRERFAEAQEWCEVGHRRFPTEPNFIDCALRVVGWSGSGRVAINQAWRLLAEVEVRDPTPRFPTSLADRRMMVAAVLARSGLADSARAVVRRVRLTVTDADLRTDMAYPEAYVALLNGEREEALRLLSTYLTANPTVRTYVAGSAWFRSLAGDPRFKALVTQER